MMPPRKWGDLSNEQRREYARHGINESNWRSGKSAIPPPGDPPNDPPGADDGDYPYEQWGEYYIENMDRAFDLSDGQRLYLQERVDIRAIPLEDLKRGAKANPAQLDSWASDQGPRAYGGMNSFWYHPRAVRV